MAIKLTDIVNVMKSKWTYGDKAFGYKEEFNDNHDTQYPSLLITPPTSVFPEVTKMNGWENYTFEIYFSDLYNRTAQANETIEQRWENLQDLATEWLDNFLKNYQSSAPIQAFLDEENVVLERTKEAFNDQLVQIKLTFTWRVMSKCFIPVSTYPNQIPNLALWLRADSHVTFNIPTKKVTAWGDGSGNDNDFENATAVPALDPSDYPKRYSYGGGTLNKTALAFQKSTTSPPNFQSNAIMQSVGVFPVTGDDFTVFQVCQPTAGSLSAAKWTWGYFPEEGTGVVQPTVRNDVSAIASVYQYHSEIWGDVAGGVGTNEIDVIAPIATLAEIESNMILMTILDTTVNAPDGTGIVSVNNGAEVSALSLMPWESTPWNVGKLNIGGHSPYWSGFTAFDGNIQEFLVYDRVLTGIERAKVKDYLNKKYKIY